MPIKQNSYFDYFLIIIELYFVKHFLQSEYIINLKFINLCLILSELDHYFIPRKYFKINVRESLIKTKYFINRLKKVRGFLYADHINKLVSKSSVNDKFVIKLLSFA